MEKAKVYFTDLRTSPTSNLLDKMERLVKKAGIAQLPLKDSFVAIKIHFGEPGNLAYIRPNYAARMANLLRSYGAKPFLTDCNTLYSGRRANAVDHLESAMEKCDGKWIQPYLRPMSSHHCRRIERNRLPRNTH